MTAPVRHPLTLNARDPSNLRGDPITGDRYWSKDFAQREWDNLWTKIWHIAGRESQLKDPGDFVVHDFMHESVICVRQDDGSIRAFYNTCLHRGLRLVEDGAWVKHFMCRYHGWIWGLDGELKKVQDPEDYPQGNPCGKLRLKELRCDTWGGFVWYTMDDEAQPLLDFLSPMPEVYKNYKLDTLVRVAWMRIELNTNWKFATDNFVESYHTRTLHPQVPPWIDQHVDSARHEMFPKGHGRTVQPMRPSLVDLPPKGAPLPFDAMLREWGIDPDSYPDFETKAIQGWHDLKAAKRWLWKERGYLHYEHLNDEEITDSPHTVFFPNVTISFLPDQLGFFRTEPHPDDPSKCYFDLWSFHYPIAGMETVQALMIGERPLKEAERRDDRVFDNGKGCADIAGQIVWQDMTIAEAAQRGLRSRGYEDAYLAAQETRVRYFHEVLNDWLNGNPR